MLHDSVELGSVDIPENGELRLELPAYLVVKLFRGTAELRPIVYPCTSNAHCSGSIYEIKRIEIVSSPQERRSVRTLARRIPPTKMTQKPLQERIIEASDHLAENTLSMLEYVNRGERPPEHLAKERDRLVAELMALDKERQRVRSE